MIIPISVSISMVFRVNRNRICLELDPNRHSLRRLCLSFLKKSLFPTHIQVYMFDTTHTPLTTHTRLNVTSEPTLLQLQITVDIMNTKSRGVKEVRRSDYKSNVCASTRQRTIKIKTKLVKFVVFEFKMQLFLEASTACIHLKQC